MDTGLQERVAGLLQEAGVRIGGTQPQDIQVHDPRFFARVMAHGSLGLGESYMDGWWDANVLDDFLVHLMQAHLAIGRNDFDEAQRLSTLAGRVEPEHPELLTIDGMVALRRGDADRALALLSAASKALPDDTRVLYALGFAYLGKDMLAFAEQSFRRVLELNPSLSSLHGQATHRRHVQLRLLQGDLRGFGRSRHVALAQRQLHHQAVQRGQ